MIKRFSSPDAIRLKASAITRWWLPSINAGQTSFTNARKSSFDSSLIRALDNSSSNERISCCRSAGSEPIWFCIAAISTFKNYTKIFPEKRGGAYSEKNSPPYTSTSIYQLDRARPDKYQYLKNLDYTS